MRLTRARVLALLVGGAGTGLAAYGGYILVYGTPAPPFREAVAATRVVGGCVELEMKPGTFVTPARFVTAYREELGLGEGDDLRPRASFLSRPDWLDRGRAGEGLVARTYEHVHAGVPVAGSDLILQVRGSFVERALSCKAHL